jgi:hypothetical protein
VLLAVLLSRSLLHIVSTVVASGERCNAEALHDIHVLLHARPLLALLLQLKLQLIPALCLLMSEQMP